MTDGAPNPKTSPKPGLMLTRWVFLRALGVVYLIVFVSLWIQLDGLIGSRGLSPASDWLSLLAEHHGESPFWDAPTVFWIFGAEDWALHAVCGLGVLASGLLIAGVTPMASLVVLWVSWLSITQVGGRFLLFQWDALLLEVGFLAIVLAPRGWRPGLARASPVPVPIVWLLRIVLFRLMFSSGWVKLASGDATWRDLSALGHHYQTQPLANWVAWYAHKLPEVVQEISVLGMFVVELLVPFLIFAPRRGRLAGFWILASFQVVLWLTGNFAFFTILTLALCLLLLDDGVLGKAVPPHLKPLKMPERRTLKTWPRRALLVFVVVFGGLAMIQQVGTLVGRGQMPGVLKAVVGSVSPFHLVNRYGVFAVMTTARHEIVIEGSHDGQNWKAYGFAHKPGDVRRPPDFVAPHQPRLDWQMWFAALKGDCRRGSRWFITFQERLLEGEPDVLALLEHNPFEGSPPRYVRAVLYDYRFSTHAEREETGAWWIRSPMRLYCPVISRPRSAARP